MNIRWLLRSAADLPPEDAWLAPEERRRLAGFVAPKRRADWRLGRWTAKRLLARPLDLNEADLARLEIRAAADRAPDPWLDGRPLSLTLSLSHAAGHALAALVEGRVPLGCDVEAVEPRSAAFLADYLTAAERAAIAAAPTANRPLLANLSWSAKESTLKALRVGLTRDTRSVEVTLPTLPPSLDPITPWHPLTTRDLTTARSFVGWWRREGDLVLTVVVDSPRAEMSVLS